MITCQDTPTKDACHNDCLESSGGDPEDKSSMKFSNKKKVIKEAINTCVEGGKTKKQCLKEQ